MPAGSGKTRTSRAGQPTRTRASCPPSVIQAALSGPWITPCGAEPRPSGTSSVRPVFGSNQPRSPLCWAVNQTPPSGAGATLWMPARRGVASGHERMDAAPCARSGQPAMAAAPARAFNASRRAVRGIVTRPFSCAGDDLELDAAIERVKGVVGPAADDVLMESHAGRLGAGAERRDFVGEALADVGSALER